MIPVTEDLICAQWVPASIHRSSDQTWPSKGSRQPPDASGTTVGSVIYEQSLLDHVGDDVVKFPGVERFLPVVGAQRRHGFLETQLRNQGEDGRGRGIEIVEPGLLFVEHHSLIAYPLDV